MGKHRSPGIIRLIMYDLKTNREMATIVATGFLWLIASFTIIILYTLSEMGGN
jgi:hypothetical protein